MTNSQNSNSRSNHIARHRVSPAEADDIVNVAVRPYPLRIEEDKLVVRGPTEAGRLLQVIYVLKSPPMEKLMKTKSKTTDENDFDALDRLARGIDKKSLKPLTSALRRRWEAARRARPEHVAAAQKSIPTLIALDAGLLERLDAQARKAGISRSQFVSDAIEQRMVP